MTGLADYYKSFGKVLTHHIESIYNDRKPLTKTEKRWLVRLMPTILAEIQTTDCKTARNRLQKLLTNTELKLQTGTK